MVASKTARPSRKGVIFEQEAKHFFASDEFSGGGNKKKKFSGSDYRHHSEESICESYGTFLTVSKFSKECLAANSFLQSGSVRSDACD